MTFLYWPGEPWHRISGTLTDDYCFEWDNVRRLVELGLSILFMTGRRESGL